MQDDEAPPSRLNAIMGAIDEAMARAPAGKTVASLMQRREDIENTARFLISTYGEGALARAKLLEKRRDDSGFARAIRLAVERVVEAGKDA